MPYLTASLRLQPIVGKLNRYVARSRTVPVYLASSAGGRRCFSDATAENSNKANTERKVPDYVQERLHFFRKLKIAADMSVESHLTKVIFLTLPQSRLCEGESGDITPYKAIQSFKRNMSDVFFSKVDGELWDLDRPLKRDCSVDMVMFDSEEGRRAYWNSTAFLLCHAMEICFGGLVTEAKPDEEGFHCDMLMEQRLSAADYQTLRGVCLQLMSERLPFQRLEMKREDLLKMFAYNKFKVEVIQNTVLTPTATVYRCGNFVDLSPGPHLRHTGLVKGLSILKHSSSRWQGDSTGKQLQRVYGISFPSRQMKEEWQEKQEAEVLRDHRRRGKDQELFFFHEYSPGSCFFLPGGAHIYNKLIEFLRSEYRKRGYQEVISPNIYNSKLFATSGHWDHYKENMFVFDVESQTYALKPMNCPGHCLMFKHRIRSWRELPVRFADFGVLHRNEMSGALTGLTRVRRFQQDDAHIFCTLDQIEEEIAGCLEFLRDVYTVFGFSFEIHLSTRPNQFLGEAEMWDKAEAQLEKALKTFAGDNWTRVEGDGAFYGPKIDITVTDMLKRSHQCATVQLDFQLPERFNLTYDLGQAEEGRPVMIHRAILGSVERMIAVLTEHYNGRWPFWLSPRQFAVIPIAPSCFEYAKKVSGKLFDAGFSATAELAEGTSFEKKIRTCIREKHNFLLVVGEREIEAELVSVRTQDGVKQGQFSLNEVIRRCRELEATKSLGSGMWNVAEN